MCTFNQFPPGSAPGSRGLPCPSQCRTKVPHLHPCATERSKPSSKPWSKTSKCRFVILYSLGSGELSPHCRWAPTVPADAPWDASTTAATTDRLHLPCASGWNLGEYQYHFMPNFSGWEHESSDHDAISPAPWRWGCAPRSFPTPS